MKNITFVFILIILFLFVRLYHLENRVNFGSDQGGFLLKSYKIYKEKSLSLIGPSSSFSTNGRYFYFGPATYYLPIPVLQLFNWNPLSVSYFMVFLQLISLLCIILSFKLRMRSDIFIFIYSVLYTFLPLLINYSNFHWNPNYTVFVSGFVLSLIIFINGKTNVKVQIFLIGLLSGLGMQFHYSFTLCIFLVILMLVRQRNLKFSDWILAILGLIIGFFPVLLFELRHNFYNLKTIILFVSTRGSQNQVFQILPYYFLSAIPFIIYFTTYGLNKIYKFNKIIIYLFLTIIITYSIYTAIPDRGEGFDMARGWNYEGLKKTEKIISEQKHENYNLVDLLTGDTRAQALRYLLTVSGNEPKNESAYPDSLYLFIYSRDSIEKILGGSLWEIDVIKPVVLEKTWDIQNGIKLYLVKRNEK
jgi:hypothetical protein